MNITKDMLALVWFEDEHGNKNIPLSMSQKDFPNRAVYPYLHLRLPHIMREEVVGSDGKILVSAGMGWNEELVVALYSHTEWPLFECIVIAATACERCMNVLGYENHLSWGYAEGSPQWLATKTECQFCSTSEPPTKSVSMRAQVSASCSESNLEDGQPSTGTQPKPCDCDERGQICQRESCTADTVESQ